MLYGTYLQSTSRKIITIQFIITLIYIICKLYGKYKCKISNSVYDKNKNKKNGKIDFELVECIINTKADLNVANKNFEQAEGDLIDYYSYQIKANKAKLDYLIKEVKQKGFSLDTINELKLRIS